MGIVSAALGDHDSGAALDAEPDRVPGDCSSQGSEIAELACEWSRVGGNPEANGTVSSDARAAWVANIVNVRGEAFTNDCE